MLVVPSITFNGQAEEAINFYCQVFNGEVKNLVRYEEEPNSQAIPNSYKKRIAIAWLYFGNGRNRLTMCDAAHGESYLPGNNIKMDMFFEENEIHTIFDALSKGGKVIIPLTKTYFSPNFGHIIDKFGIYWYLSVLQPPQ